MQALPGGIKALAQDPDCGGGTELAAAALREACRVIYESAAADLALPPLLRDAAASPPPARRLAAHVGDLEIELTVELGAAAFPASTDPGEAPLRFSVAARRRSGGAPPGIDERQRHELIRAFLLGVAAPVAIEGSAATESYRIAFRLSERFVTPVIEDFRPAPAASAAEVCAQAAEPLWRRTQNLFADQETGLAVWKSRLEQELFGEPAKAACELWPEPAWLEADPEGAKVAPIARGRRRVGRQARALRAIGVAMLACGGLALALFTGAGARRALDEIGPAGGAPGPSLHVAALAPRPAPQAAAASILLASTALDRPSVFVAFAPNATPPLARLAPDAVAEARALEPGGATHAPLAKKAVGARPAPRRLVAHRRPVPRGAAAGPVAEIKSSFGRLKRAVGKLRLSRLKLTPGVAHGAEGPR